MTTKTISELLADLRDPDVLIRQGAARALGDASESDNETVKARLLIALHDEQAIVRRAAAGALEKLGQSAPTTRSISGGVNFKSGRIDVGGDVIGRDKIVVLDAQVDDEGRAASAYFTGVRLVEQNHWYDGLALLTESLSIRRQHANLGARADTIYQIARTHQLMGNYDQARIHYRDALRLYGHINNRQGVAACRTGLGRLMIQLGFADNALFELAAARQIYKELGDDKRVGEVEEVFQLVNRI